MRRQRYFGSFDKRTNCLSIWRKCYAGYLLLFQLGHVRKLYDFCPEPYRFVSKWRRVPWSSLRPLKPKPEKTKSTSILLPSRTKNETKSNTMYSCRYVLDDLAFDDTCHCCRQMRVRCWALETGEGGRVWKTFPFFLRVLDLHTRPNTHTHQWHLNRKPTRQWGGALSCLLPRKRKTTHNTKDKNRQQASEEFFFRQRPPSRLPRRSS